METLNDKSQNFYKLMLTLAIPIAAQNLIQSSLNLVDNIMIGNLGDTSIAAVGLANQVYFLFVLLLFGVNSGMAIFISQYHGIEDYRNIRKSMGLALILGLLFSIPFTLAAYYFPNFILSLFIKEADVISLGAKYLKIISFSYVITAFSFTMSITLRSIGKANIPMIISFISLSINTFLNYVLIFGKFGMPALGVEGAAIATVIARVIEVILYIYYVYLKDEHLRGNVIDMFSYSKSYLKKVYQTITPVVLNEAFWSVGVTLYVVAYGQMGTEAVAAYNIGSTIQRMFFIIVMGIGSACQVMIGKKLGANDYESAIDYANRFFKLSIVVGLVLTALMMLTSKYALLLYNISDSLRESTEKVLFVFAVFMILKLLNVIFIIGIFRGGGDTKFALYLEILSVYLVGVPLSFLGVKLGLPIYTVVFMTSLEELSKAIMGTKRYRSNKWANNVIQDIV